MSRRIPGLLLPLPVLALLAAPAAGQESYAAPGTLGESAETARQRISTASQNARWQLGDIDLEPRLFIGDVRYVSNVFSSSEGETTSDLRGSAVAGLRAFFNLGPKVLVSPYANLSYAWWREQTELRELSESFGLQMFGDLNRLQFQIQAGQNEAQRNLSSEVEVPVVPRNRQVEISADVNFWRSFSLFGSVARRETRYSGSVAEREVPGLVLSTIDSDGSTVSGGVSYQFRNGVRVGLGYVDGETDYLDDIAGRSRRSSGPLVRLGLDGPRLSLSFDGSLRDLEFATDEGVNQREQLFGLGVVRWKLTERLTSRLYHSAGFNASALDRRAVYESRRTGIGGSFEPGERVRLRAYAEVGEDRYATADSDVLTRQDDFTSYGATYELLLTRRLTLELGYSNTRRESTDPLFDRDLESLTVQVQLGGSLLSW